MSLIENNLQARRSSKWRKRAWAFCEVSIYLLADDDLNRAIDLCVCRQRELKLKENAATSRIRSVGTVAGRTGTSRRSDALRPATPAAKSDATIGRSSPRGERARARAGCEH